MFKKLGVQLYTVRDSLQDPDFADLTFRRLAEMGYTEAHTAGNAFDAKLFGELLQKHGIQIIGTHYSWDKILNDPDQTIAHHRMWNTTNIGIGGMPGPARENLGELKKFIADFNRAAESYAKEGFKLNYHNHHFEFIPIDGRKTIMEILYEELDPVNTSFVLDTCWVAAGGGDVSHWIERLAGRLDILHLKDMVLVNKHNGGPLEPNITEVGYGNLYWDSILAAAERAGVKHYIVEHDWNFTGTALNSLKLSADYLKKYMK